MRARLIWRALAGLVLTASCSSGAPKNAEPTPTNSSNPPAVANGPNRALWQAAIGGRPIIIDDLIVASAKSGGVEAYDSRTGRRRWQTQDGKNKGIQYVRAAGSSVVFVTAGPPQGPSGMAMANAIVAVDLGTGRHLWRRPLSDTIQLLGFAVTDKLAVVADADGTVAASDIRSGRVLWSVPQPTTCSPRPAGGAGNVAVTADKDLVTVVRLCEPGGRSFAQGLDATTGRERWKWETPSELNQGQLFALASPPGSGVVFVPTAISSVAALVRPWSGPDAGFGGRSQFVVLDAATGRRLWRQENTAADTFLSGPIGIVCLVANDAYECRRATNGLLLFSSRPSHQQLSAYDDGHAAAVAGGFSYELDVPSGGEEQLVTRSIADGRVVGRTTLAISEHSPPSSNYGPDVVTAGDGIVLVRRADAANFPILALATK